MLENQVHTLAEGYGFFLRCKGGFLLLLVLKRFSNITIILSLRFFKITVFYYNRDILVDINKRITRKNVLYLKPFKYC